jgi:ornithine cyclodeaminase/alanine dehydrogenase-like protein (mu-crystallin family)
MIPYLDAAAIRRLRPRDAVSAIEQVLRDGFDPANDPARTIVSVEHGQFLMMPSNAGSAAGVKVATVAPGNAAHGLPRVHAVYVHFDAETLAPQVILDGTALTTLRTPAVSVAAVRSVLTGPVDVVVFGTGPQGTGHVATLADTVGVRRATYVVRSQRDVPDAAVILAGSPGVPRALAEADVVVCATSAREPLFESSALRDDVVVIAVGSHEPDTREVDAALCSRATVVVEDVAIALRESGEVVLAIADGALTAQDLVPMRSIVAGEVRLGRPVLFTSSGMSWEDLAVARAVVALAG